MKGEFVKLKECQLEMGINDENDHDEPPDQICDSDQEPATVWILLGFLSHWLYGGSPLQGAGDDDDHDGDEGDDDKDDDDGDDDEDVDNDDNNNNDDAQTTVCQMSLKNKKQIQKQC